MLDWCVTFFVYNNKWYDKISGVDYVSDIPKVGDEYISIGAQANMLKKWIAQILSKNAEATKVKIFFAEVKIDINNTSSINIYESGYNNRPGSVIPRPQIPSAGTSAFSLSYIIENTFGVYDATHNALITIGHGSVFGINLYDFINDEKSSKSDLLDSVVQKLPSGLSKRQVSSFNLNEKNLFNETFSNKIVFESKLTDNNYESAFGHITTNVLDIQLLTLNEIKESIKEYFLTKNKKLDILVFDSCLMNNIFSQFELSDCVDYLVASQSGITYPGFNYISMLEKIFSDTKSNAESVSNILVTKMREHPEFKNYKNFISTWCIRSQKLDSEKLKEIAGSLAKLVNLILNTKKTDIIFYKNALISIISDTFVYDIYSLQGQLSIKDINIIFLLLRKEMNSISGKVKDKMHFENLKSEIESLVNLIKDYLTKSKSFYMKEIFEFNNNTYLDEELAEGLSFGIPLSIEAIGSEIFNVFKNAKTPYNPQVISQIRYKDFFQFLVT